jgi:hypothetical protein
MGMNTPLMKTKGNLTRFVIIIIFEGTFVGGVENSIPRYDAQNADSKIAATRTTGHRDAIESLCVLSTLLTLWFYSANHRVLLSSYDY